MCKIVKYWFTCNHGFRLRQSKCGGTKHKRTRAGPAPACRSESYLSIILQTDCGPCQHSAFEKVWNRRLSLAELFLEKLKEKDFPGVHEVAALVEQLKDEFNTATWDTRTLFPHAHKDRAVRINLGHFERKVSPLRCEVSPDDIPDTPDVINPSDPRYEYDWNYVASTDPSHPVDVNDAHPLDGVDLSCVQNHLSPEEFEQTNSGVGFDASEANVFWEGRTEETSSSETGLDGKAEGWVLETILDTETPISGHNREYEQPRGAAFAGQSREQSHQAAERVDLVVRTFWRLVNDESEQQYHVPSTPEADLRNILRDVHLGSPSYTSGRPNTGVPTPPPTPPQPACDGSCDAEPVGISSLDDQDPESLPSSTAGEVHPRGESTSQTTCPQNASSSDSTRALYDKIRWHMSKTKNLDEARFHKSWLELSRCEIKDLERLNGRIVQHP